MKAGDLDQRIDLLKSTATREGMGEVVEDYAVLRKVWARPIEGTGKEFIASGQIAAQARAVFKIRFAADLFALGTQMRIGWGRRLWEVTNMTGTNSSGELWLHCESIGTYP